MREYADVASWAAGAVGRPGERTFMIQFTADDGVHAFVLEKAQVAALVIEARRLVAAIGETAEASSASSLDPQVVPEFRIGEIHLAFREADGRVQIRLIPTSDDVDDVRFSVGTAQFAGALDAAQEAVEGGRPKCPRCGLAMDPDGHHCPATNGDLRGHRP